MSCVEMEGKLWMKNPVMSGRRRQGICGLNSVRQDSEVDPDKVVYVEGIMKVLYSSEDIDYEDEPEDFLSFQSKVREIPDDFWHKNKEKTEEAFFYCHTAWSATDL